MSPSKLSVAVAPSSVYTLPRSTVAGFEPIIVITGGDTSMAYDSVTITGVWFVSSKNLIVMLELIGIGEL